MITEDQLEQLCLEWFQSIGYDYICGYDIAPGEAAAERSEYRQIILHDRLLSRLEVINSHTPTVTLEQQQKSLVETRNVFLPKLLSGELAIESTQTELDKTA